MVLNFLISIHNLGIERESTHLGKWYHLCCANASHMLRINVVPFMTGFKSIMGRAQKNVWDGHEIHYVTGAKHFSWPDLFHFTHHSLPFFFSSHSLAPSFLSFSFLSFSFPQKYSSSFPCCFIHLFVILSTFLLLNSSFPDYSLKVSKNNTSTRISTSFHIAYRSLSVVLPLRIYLYLFCYLFFHF